MAAAVVAVRLVGLGDYPDLHPDEGFWAGGARNYVLFGDPLMDGRLHPFLSPAHFVLLCAYFTVAVPNLVTARLFSALAGLLTCVVVAILGRRFFPKRPWLYLLLFGLSSLAVLIQRKGLLEADQILWLTLAAAFWLLPLRGRSVLAGIAFGLALLVKSNALFLLPAFVVIPPGPEPEPSGEDSVSSTAPRRPWLAVALFLLSFAVVGGGGYLAARAVNPEHFDDAFGFELRGQRFIDDDVVFHVGRFGYNKQLAPRVAKELITTDPLLLVLAGIWLVQLPWRYRSTSPADRFFALWVGLDLVFHFSQVYFDHRYLTTLAPALAWLSARTVNDWLDRPLLPALKCLSVAVLVLFVAFHLSRFTVGALRQPNVHYWATVSWIKEHVPPDGRVMAAPYIGLSLSQRSYDFYRLAVPYDLSLPRRPLADVVRDFRIGYIIVDSEWRIHEDRDEAHFLATRCALLTEIDDVKVYRVKGS